MKYKPKPISHTPQLSKINVGHPPCRTEVTPVMLFMSIDQRGSKLITNNPARASPRVVPTAQASVQWHLK